MRKYPPEPQALSDRSSVSFLDCLSYTCVVGGAQTGGLMPESTFGCTEYQALAVSIACIHYGPIAEKQAPLILFRVHYVIQQIDFQIGT